MLEMATVARSWYDLLTLKEFDLTIQRPLQMTNLQRRTMEILRHHRVYPASPTFLPPDTPHFVKQEVISLYDL